MTDTPPPRPAPQAQPAAGVRVGVFDSGVGGLSVLRALHRALDRERHGAALLYVADSGHAPYGEKGDAFVVQRARRIADFLVAEGCSVLVVACNTATAAAVQELRQAHPELRIVGVEPGIKPAVALSRAQRIGVLATSGTLGSEKFRRLAEQHAAGATLVLQPCPGLAAALEQGDADAPQVLELVERYCAPLREAGVDTVVLGCTHYPFAAAHIARVLGPGVHLVDTADAVARQAARQLPTAAAAGGPPQGGSPRPRLWTTGSVATLRTVSQRWLDFDCDVAGAALDV